MITIKCDVKDCKVEYSFECYLSRGYGDTESKITPRSKTATELFEKFPGQRMAQGRNLQLCIDHSKEFTTLDTDVMKIRDAREKSILGIEEKKEEAKK